MFFIKLIFVLFVISKPCLGENINVSEEKVWETDGFSKIEVEKIIKPKIKNDKTVLEYPKSNSIKRDSFFEFSHEDIGSFSQFKDIELLEKIQHLKEDVFKLKTELFLLSEESLQSKVSTSGIVIIQQNNLSQLFRGETVSYVINNEIVFNDVYLDKKMPSRLKIFEKITSPGLYEVKLKINFTGRGKGIYSYLNDYVFSIKSKKNVSIIEGKQTVLIVNLNDSNFIFKSINNRPKIKFAVSHEKVDNSIFIKKVY